MATSHDPRNDNETSVRPVIETPRRIVPMWVIVAVGVLLGTGLFLQLNAQRIAKSAPPVKATATALAASGPDLPALYIPPPISMLEPVELVVTPPVIIPKNMLVSASEPQTTSRAMPHFEAPTLPPVFPDTPAPIVRRGDMATERVLLFDGTVGDSAISAAENGQSTNSGSGLGNSALANSSTPASLARARPGALLNRATIVPQGTLISAVLETALDSTRAGGTRALVTRDVVGFDGAKVIIPRGSRLYGEYRADLAPGQNRALVMWTRLVRPDGVSIALDSPAADPLGRAGIKGKVDNHFLERFSTALLQTALDIGSNVATREISRGSTAVIALPGSFANSSTSGTSSSLLGGGNFQRTLKVRQGVSVSVFVSRDLDFTGVDTR